MVLPLRLYPAQLPRHEANDDGLYRGAEDEGDTTIGPLRLSTDEWRKKWISKVEEPGRRDPHEGYGETKPARSICNSRENPVLLIVKLSRLAPLIFSVHYRFQTHQMKISSYLLLLFIFLVNPLSAQDKGSSPFKLLMGGALELGGDRAGWINTETNGSQQIRGAQGVSLTTGVQFRPKSMDRVMLHATVGYKYWQTLTEGAHVRMTRIPVHLTAHYWLNDNFRVGLGVLTDRNIRFRSDGLGEDHNYDPSFGTKLEIGWRNLALGYTRMRYYGATDRDRCAGGFGLTYLIAL
jgi:hypothetical protein